MNDLDTLCREIEGYLKKYAIDDEARYVIAPQIAKKRMKRLNLTNAVEKQRLELFNLLKFPFFGK